MSASKVVRRRPRQARSQGTVDAIYAATVQIIEREGGDTLTMKRVSDVSGYSIGTLYQYFQDRDSLLMAMAIAHRDRLIERLKAVLAASQDQPCRDAITGLVAVLAADARSKRKTFRAAARAVARKGMTNRFLNAMRVLDDAIARTLADLAAGRGIVLSPVCQFVLSRSLTSVLWSAVMEDSELLDAPDLEAQLCNLLMAGMTPGPASRAGHAQPDAQAAPVVAHA